MACASRWLLVFCLTVPCSRARAADEVKKPDEPRIEAGKSVGPTASFIRRESAEKDWQVVRENEAVRTGDLLLTGTRGSLESADGAVRLSAIGELAGLSSVPVIETAIVLHEPKNVDLDFTLDRGRVELLNTKKEGAAHVRVRIGDRDAVVSLTQPGDRLALEVYGRWPRGVRFEKKPKPGTGPAIAVVALALKGEIDVKGKNHHVTLKAPPGPALLYVHNLEDEMPSPRHLDSLPDWAKDGGRPEETAKMQALAKRFRATATSKSVHQAIEEILNSEDREERQIGMYLLAATDDLPTMWKVMRDTRDLELWDAGVVALRHWIGRCPGQDQKLYEGLVEKAKLKPVHAETVLQMLHSFGDDQVAQPETYQMLIGYLQHELRPIRGLAYWHLQRLVPEGKKLGYDPLASREEREKAVEEWRKLVPPGKLPPERKPEGSGK